MDMSARTHDAESLGKLVWIEEAEVYLRSIWERSEDDLASRMIDMWVKLEIGMEFPEVRFASILNFHPPPLTVHVGP